MAHDKGKWMFLAISGQNTLCSTRAMEKEQEPVLSLLQAKQREGQGKYQGPAAGTTQHEAIPQIPTRCPARVNAEDQLVDAERSTNTHCPASAGARWITFGEKYTTTLL